MRQGVIAIVRVGFGEFLVDDFVEISTKISVFFNGGLVIEPFLSGMKFAYHRWR